MANLRIQIIMPDKTKLDDLFDLVTLPGADGDFEIQEGHAPFITKLRSGIMRIEKKGMSEYYALHDGFISVENNHVIILSETCESKAEINLDRAMSAKERAEKRMASKAIESDIDFRRAEQALKKALTRIVAINTEQKTG